MNERKLTLNKYKIFLLANCLQSTIDLRIFYCNGKKLAGNFFPRLEILIEFFSPQGGQLFSTCLNWKISKFNWEKNCENLSLRTFKTNVFSIARFFITIWRFLHFIACQYFISSWISVAGIARMFKTEIFMVNLELKRIIYLQARRDVAYCPLPTHAV